MTSAGSLLRAARRRSRLTQAAVAERLGTTQAAIAQLERPRANPTVETLERVLRAAGHRLELSAAPRAASIDESLLARTLALTPAERVRAFEAAYAGARSLAIAAARARARLA
jgi:transcriptional regulator with XRE-family HTH domain